MRPPSEIVQMFGVRSHQYQYTDDVQISSFSSDPGALLQCLAVVGDQMQVNQLKLNPDKLEVMVAKLLVLVGIGTASLMQFRLPLPLRFTAVGCTWIIKWQWLGQLHLMKVLQPFLSDSDLATITHAFITSRHIMCSTWGCS